MTLLVLVLLQTCQIRLGVGIKRCGECVTSYRHRSYGLNRRDALDDGVNVRLRVQVNLVLMAPERVGSPSQVVKVSGVLQVVATSGCKFATVAVYIMVILVEVGVRLRVQLVVVQLFVVLLLAFVSAVTKTRAVATVTACATATAVSAARDAALFATQVRLV